MTTWYYHMKSYRQNWISGATSTSSATASVSITDSFAGTAAISTTATGSGTYSFPTGATFTRSGGRAVTATALTSHPMAVVNGHTPNGTVNAVVAGPGAAVYGRVQDANNWLRLRSEQYTQATPYQYYNTEYQHTTYATEYLWAEHSWYDWWRQESLRALVRRQERSYSSWSAYMEHMGGYGVARQTTACRVGAPALPNPDASGTDSWGQRLVQFDWFQTATACAAPAGRNTYRLRSHTRSAPPAGITTVDSHRAPGGALTTYYRSYNGSVFPSATKWGFGRAGPTEGTPVGVTSWSFTSG
ncbi:hypothetical protein [Nocardioides sp. cx-169]|uniref:hypothetical protein n=1 Tax=Nocardioides sp. cx-169 TaxID=2899080 RepID=UPI001E3A6DFE|nr:hypothetical protein [Nocardioides sp. cx-169]